jgi:hypothetical protein
VVLPAPGHSRLSFKLLHVLSARLRPRRSFWWFSAACIQLRLADGYCTALVIVINSSAVLQLMVCEALDIVKETYFAILLDRASSGPVMVASAEGGVDIEEVNLGLLISGHGCRNLAVQRIVQMDW